MGDDFISQTKIRILGDGGVFIYQYVSSFHSHISVYYRVTENQCIASLFFFFSFQSRLWHMEIPRPRVRTATAILRHSHSNTRSEPCLWPTPPLTPTHRARPGIKPTSSGILVGFTTAEPQWQLLVSSPKTWVFSTWLTLVNLIDLLDGVTWRREQRRPFSCLSLEPSVSVTEEWRLGSYFSICPTRFFLFCFLVCLLLGQSGASNTPFWRSRELR